MVCGVRRCNRLPRSTGCGDRGLVFGLSRRRMSGQGSLHRDACLDFSVGPRADGVERPLRSDVAVLAGKQRQHALGTICSPSSKENVICPFQWTASVNGNESSISHSVVVVA